MASKELQTALAIVSAFNKMDIETIISLRTPTCKRTFLPTSLNYAPQTNAASRAQLNGMKSVFTNFQVTVADIIEGWSTSTDGTQQRKKIVMYVEATGQTPVGEYKNEYVWKLAFDEAGEKVDEWSEYVDVGKTRDFYPLLRGEMVRRMGQRQDLVRSRSEGMQR